MDVGASLARYLVKVPKFFRRIVDRIGCLNKALGGWKMRISLQQDVRYVAVTDQSGMAKPC